MSFRFFSLSSTMRISSFAMAHRQRERERRPGPDLTLHPDPAAMQLDKFPAQRQPEARPFRLLVRGPHLTEFLEHRVVILRRDADARVRYRDLRRPVHYACSHLNPPALRRELHGVREQIQQDLFHLALVRVDLAHAFIDLALERDPPP